MPAPSFRTGVSMRQPRRVLLLPILFYPEPWNGIMEQLRLLALLADPTRYAFTLGLRPGDGPQTATLAERAGLDVARLGDGRSPAELRRACREHGIDIVHMHTPSTSGVARLALGARLARVPAVVTYHQVQPHRLGARSRAVNRLAQQLLVSRSLAVSGGIAETLARNGGLRRRGIEVVLNGILEADPESRVPELAREDGAIWLLYAGRLAAEKGLAFLLDGFAAARRRDANVRLAVVGEGYERAALEAQAGALGIAATVTFTGFQPDARAWMRAADVVVHVPEFEGFGLSIIEAMEAARPVIASNVRGGIPELIDDGETGLLVPYGDAQALAGAVVRLAADEALRKRMGVEGRARYERLYRADSMVARTMSIYGSV